MRPGGLRYQCREGWFALFASSGRPSGDHTQIAFEVEDIEQTVRELRARGVVFEEYESPGLRTSDDQDFPYVATTFVESPPRAVKAPVTVIRRGRHAATRSSRILLVAAS